MIVLNFSSLLFAGAGTALLSGLLFAVQATALCLHQRHACLGSCSWGFYVFAIFTVVTHSIVIFRMPLTYLLWERSFTNTFAIFAELALHVGTLRCQPIINPTRNDLLTPYPFLSYLSSSSPSSLSHLLLPRSPSLLRASITIGV